MASERIAVDFDGLYTNIYKVGNGIVLSEPTVTAIGTEGNKDIKAVGYEAKKLIGKTAENTKIVFPVFEGEIVNEAVAEELLIAFLRKIEIKSRLLGVTALFSVPCGVSEQVLEKYQKVAKRAGISKVFFAEATILSALGQHLPLNDSNPCFLIDMAGGVTNISALSLDGIIAGLSINCGANNITTDIIDHIVENFGLQIGLLTAERIKNEIGSLSDNDVLYTLVNGRDVKTGKPRSITIRANDLLIPIKAYYDRIAELAQSVLVKLPPEVSADIRHSGIYISGISASVYGLEKYYSDIFGMPINIGENPDKAVALGGGIAVGNNDLLQKISIKR